MDNFWFVFWKSVMIVLCVLIATIGGCNMHADYRISQMVEHGANPLDAYCAVAASNSASVCPIRASKE